MSEPITWATTSDKERVRLVLQHVMGCFVLDATATGWRTPEFPARGRELAAMGFHWPIAFWNTDGECWMMRDIATDPEIFDPLKDWNDAWAVFLHTMEQHCPADHQWFGQDFPSFRAFVETLMGDFDCAYNDEIYPGQAIFPEIAKWTPEIICIASLRACGLEIVT